jgi:thioredoxin reductase (NADPH)
MNPALLAFYVIPAIALLGWYLYMRRRREDAAIAAAEEAIEASMTEPPSLHPVIDPMKCIGCRSCVAACPEQGSHPVLGMIRGKAYLVGPANCIGHGACYQACPEGAIELVFGTARRGVDIPTIKPDFETNIPGIFIAGELGGMGLIRNAVEQGRQALDSIRKLKGFGKSGQHDLVIVGAGPAGIAASLGALDAGLDFVTLEQDSLGGTVAHFPRGKLVMTRPAVLPIVGKMQFKETSKEKLLEFWQGVESQTGLQIGYNERVTAINRLPDGKSFEVVTEKSSYRTRAVLLTIGRRGTPRQLGVPGEDLPKVVYRLTDAEQYKGQKVLVVGGGDSALEAAHTIAEQPGTSVSISYRSEAFSRAKPKNRDKVAELVAAGRMKAFMKSNVLEIREDAVILETEKGKGSLPNDAVIICAGGILPTGFLREIGIEVETKYGTA